MEVNPNCGRFDCGVSGSHGHVSFSSRTAPRISGKFRCPICGARYSADDIDESKLLCRGCDEPLEPCSEDLDSSIIEQVFRAVSAIPRDSKWNGADLIVKKLKELRDINDRRKVICGMALDQFARNQSIDWDAIRAEIGGE